MRLNDKLENFAQAFRSGFSGCVRTCNCGQVFFDYQGHYDWEEGELEKLQVGPATGLDYSIETLVIDGKEYCIDCHCWHEQAEALMNYFDERARQIAHYLTLEKKRKQTEADISPIVK